MNHLNNLLSLMDHNSSVYLRSDNFRQELRQYMSKVNQRLLVIEICICLMGVLGNLLVLIIINRKPLKNTSSSVFITYMAIFDGVVLLLQAITLTKRRPSLFFHCTLIYLIDLSTFSANWILVIITLERCVAVHSPFLAKRVCTIHSARRSMYILFSIALIFFSITFPFMYDPNVTHSSHNRKCHVRVKAEFILRIHQTILFYAIPDLLLLSNLFIVYALCQRRQQLSSIHLNSEQRLDFRINDVHSSRKQRQLTIMLVTVSLSFYLFTTPVMIMYIKENYPPKYQKLNQMKRDFLISQLSVVLSQLNYATNFILYCFAGKRFRQVTTQTYYDYSTRLKIFYHRYILCNKQYRLTPTDQIRLNHVPNSTITYRSPCSPQQHRYLHKTLTV